MAGRVERKVDALDGPFHTVGDAFGCYVAETVTHNRLGCMGAQITAMSGTGVVGMAMGDDGTLDRPPGVDVDPGVRAEDAPVGELKQRQWNSPFAVSVLI